MDNLEKLATQVTQNEEKQSKNSTQYVLDTTMYNYYFLLQHCFHQYLLCIGFWSFFGTILFE
jgi:hypothetical protein